MDPKAAGQLNMELWLTALIATGYEKGPEFTTDKGSTITLYQDKTRGKVCALVCLGDTGEWIALYPMCGFWKKLYHHLDMNPNTKWLDIEVGDVKKIIERGIEIATTIGEPEVEQYEVWIESSGRMVRWSDTGGVAGPMPKEKADEYVKGLMDRADVHAEARPIRKGAPAWFKEDPDAAWEQFVAAQNHVSETDRICSNIEFQRNWYQQALHKLGIVLPPPHPDYPEDGELKEKGLNNLVSALEKVPKDTDDFAPLNEDDRIKVGAAIENAGIDGGFNRVAADIIKRVWEDIQHKFKNAAR
jgi:hypothetical protein